MSIPIKNISGGGSIPPLYDTSQLWAASHLPTGRQPSGGMGDGSGTSGVQFVGTAVSAAINDPNAPLLSMAPKTKPPVTIQTAEQTGLGLLRHLDGVPTGNVVFA